MQALLIDPKARTITPVEYTGDYKEINAHIEADLFDVVRLYPNGDGAFVDDEGLLKDPEYFWAHRNYPQPLAGRGLLLGVDAEGESIAPGTDLDTLCGDVVFFTVHDLRKAGFIE